MLGLFAMVEDLDRRLCHCDSLAGARRHPALHGHCPQLCNGVQSTGRSTHRRGQSTHRRPASARRHPQRAASNRVRRRLCGRLHRQHAPVFAEPVAAVFCRSRCSHSWPATASPSDSRRSPISGSAQRSRFRPIAAWIAIRGEASSPTRPTAAGARPRRRRTHLGRRVRYHLRLPGPRRRRRRGPPQYSRSPRHSETPCDSPPSATCSRSSR